MREGDRVIILEKNLKEMVEHYHWAQEILDLIKLPFITLHERCHIRFYNHLDDETWWVENNCERWAVPESTMLQVPTKPMRRWS